MKNVIYAERDFHVKEITDNKILFSNGWYIRHEHEQDCCEQNYADFKALIDTTFEDRYFSRVSFEVVEHGIRINGYFVPCYSVQNGYYDNSVYIILKNANHEVLWSRYIEAKEDEYGPPEREELTSRNWDTGARRDNDNGKPKLLYIPLDVMERISFHLEAGAKKYGNHNWRKGIPSSEYYNSMMRHISAYWIGKDDEDHLSALAFNVFGLIYNDIYFRDNKDIYDMPKHWENIIPK